jgi:hypothetical protein
MVAPLYGDQDIGIVVFPIELGKLTGLLKSLSYAYCEAHIFLNQNQKPV